MNFRCQSRQHLLFYTLLACLFIFNFNNSSFAQDDKSAIVLYTSNVEITYHQPFRNSYRSAHPSYIEVPKLESCDNGEKYLYQYIAGKLVRDWSK